MREKIIERVLSEKLVVVVHGVASPDLVPLTEAMYAGGVRPLEITYSADGSVSDADTDMMRGEETEVMGLISHDALPDKEVRVVSDSEVDSCTSLGLIKIYENR